MSTFYWAAKAEEAQEEVRELQRILEDVDVEVMRLKRMVDDLKLETTDLKREKEEQRAALKTALEEGGFIDKPVLQKGPFSVDPPKAPEGINAVKTVECTCGRAPNQYMGHHNTSCPKSPVYMPPTGAKPRQPHVPAGSWGTFEHCGNPETHGHHWHVAIFNEGPTAPMYCNGEGNPNAR